MKFKVLDKTPSWALIELASGERINIEANGFEGMGDFDQLEEGATYTMTLQKEDESDANTRAEQSEGASGTVPGVPTDL